MSSRRLIPLGIFLTVIAVVLSTPVRIEESYWAESLPMWVAYLFWGFLLLLTTMVLWLRAFHTLLGFGAQHAAHGHGHHGHDAHGHEHHGHGEGEIG